MVEVCASKAIILAAGLGKRMRSYDDQLPKPLVPIAGKPLIDYSIRLLTNAHITQTIVNTHYMADKMQDYLAAQKALEVIVSHEETLLETGGGIVNALSQLQEQFFTLNSDIICCDSAEPVLSRMEKLWDATQMDALLLLQPVEKATGYEGEGDFSLDESGVIMPRQSGRQIYVFTGIQMLHKRFFAQAPQQQAFSLSCLYRDYLMQKSTRIRGIVHVAEWFHVGDEVGVHAAETHLLADAA